MNNLFKYHRAFSKILRCCYTVTKQISLTNWFNSKLTMFHNHPIKFTFVSPLLSAIVLTDSRIDINTQLLNFDYEYNISHLIILAKIALENGEFDKAESIIETAINLCEEKQVYLALPYMYDILVTMSFAMGDYTKAESTLVKVIEKLIQLGVQESSSHIVDFKLRLSRIYSINNDTALAEIGFKNCLREQCKKIIDGDTNKSTGVLYINVLFWYGLHQIYNRNYKEAKKLITTAYDYSLKIKGLSTFQEMIVLYTLCDLHMQLGEYDLALQHIQSAILLGKGTGSLDLPKCYVTLGRIYLEMNVHDCAKTAVEEGFKMAKFAKDDILLQEAEILLNEIYNILLNEKNE